MIGELGVNTMHHNKPCVNFQHFHLMQLNGKQNKSWKGMWLAIIWEIWKHRNIVIFKQRKVDPKEIFCMTRVSAWTWMKHKLPNVTFSYSVWYQCPIQCLNHCDSIEKLLLKDKHTRFESRKVKAYFVGDEC